MDMIEVPKVRRVAYLIFSLEGDLRIAAMPTPSFCQDLSQWIVHDSVSSSSRASWEVQSTMKSASNWDLIAVLFLKSTTSSDSSEDHLAILGEASLLWSRSCRGWLEKAMILWASK